MFSARHHSFTRALLHGLTVLGLVLMAAANVSPAYAAPPANDNIGSALKITTAIYQFSVADVVPATTVAADPVISCGASQHMDSIWWVFTPANSGEVSINTNNSEYDTVLAVFKNDPAGGLIEMGCNDNSGGTTSALTLPLRGGIRYFIEVVRKTGTAVSSPDKAHINYQFTPKVVAWGEPGGKEWDSNVTNLFAYTGGWSNFPWGLAKNGALEISNNVNNTATVYFDGGTVDLYYANKPGSGNLNIYVDNNFEMGIGQNAGFSYPLFVTLGPYSDNVHKLKLVHTVGGTEVNFDYIQVYSFPDVIAPAKITTLSATTGAATGKVILKWKASGDDVNVGTATSYDLRYFVDTGVPPSCVLDWASGTTYSGPMPAPTIAGSEQQVTLSGLAPGVKYHFCIAAVDEVGNAGIPSNRAAATALAGAALGTGTYDDIHLGWTYIGNWALINNPDARNNTQHNSTKIGDLAAFTFTGKQFVFTYITGPANGLMDVYIDNVYITTIDQYTFYPNSSYYTSPMQALGPHTVRFVHMTQAIVTVDQIYIWNPNDFGPPDPIIDFAAVPGGADGEVDLSWTSTGDDPGNVGSPERFEIRYSSSPINNLVDWDNAEAAGGIFPAPVAGGLVQNVTVTGLTPGAHYYFAARSFDNAWYDVLSNSADSDVTYGGVYAPAGVTYEENDPIWEFNAAFPGWAIVTDATASGGQYRRINNAPEGSSARFWFSGTRFRLYFQQGTGYGKLDVYVDGTKIGRIDQYYVGTRWWTALFSGLAPGNHVVEFRVVGGKASIDAIRPMP